MIILKARQRIENIHEVDTSIIFCGLFVERKLINVIIKNVMLGHDVLLEILFVLPFELLVTELTRNLLQLLPSMGERSVILEAGHVHQLLLAE